VHLNNACLEIHDCTEQMAEGEERNAHYISEIVGRHMKKLDPKKEVIDMVIFEATGVEC
jgi:hypothetical protein